MELIELKISSQLFKDIFVETWRGKTIDRILLNYSLRQIKLGGDILDLGSGGSKGSYHRFIAYQEPYKIKYTDLYKKTDNPDTIVFDLEKEFPIKENSFDNITCFNVLEHIYNHNNLIREAYRILKPNGLFVGSVPFLVNYHADPNDYWRYTWQTLEKTFTSYGFQAWQMHVLSFGPLTAGYLQMEFILPRILKLFFIFVNLGLDSLLIKLKKFLRFKYPLGYLFVFKK